MIFSVFEANVSQQKVAKPPILVFGREQLISAGLFQISAASGNRKVNV